MAFMIDPPGPTGRPVGTEMGRDLAMVMAVLVGLTGISWLYLVDLAGEMDGGMGAAMGGAMDASLSTWTAYQFLLMVAMWWVMMIGMMVPSAAPMILMFSTINKRRKERQQTYVPTAVFAAGYLMIWGVFSVAATAAQWGLEEAALLSPMMVMTSPILAGLLFIAAGVYQWTPLKYACLKNCRSPLTFIMTKWRNGTGGALRMGFDHGGYCLGCCWSIMALLFVGGVMNLVWVAAIAAFVFAEKLLPAGDKIGRAAGVLMVLAGIYIMVPA